MQGGKQHCYNESQGHNAELVKSGYDGHKRRDSESAILFIFYFLLRMTIAQHQQDTTGNSISVSTLLSTGAP